MSNKKKKYQEIYQAAIFLTFDIFNKCGRQWVAIQKNIYLPWEYEQISFYSFSYNYVLVGIQFQIVEYALVMYECESWAIKRLNAEELMLSYWCCRRLLTVPWTARKSNQSILKETGPEYSLEGLILKLKLQYFGH